MEEGKDMAQEEETPLKTELPEPKPRFWLSKRYVSIGLAIVFVISVLGLFMARIYLPKSSPTSGPYLNFFQVQNITLSDEYPLPKSILINFNHEVEAHHAELYITLQPPIPGIFAQGNNSRQIKFTPDKPFAEGSYIYATVQPTFQSKSGFLLAETFRESIEIPVVKDMIKFSSNEVVGRVLNFSAYEPVVVTAKKAKRVTEGKVSLYRSDEPRLLDYLSFNQTIPNPNYPDSTEDKYISNFGVHSGADLIKEQKIDKTEQKLTYSLQPGIYYLEGSDQTQTAVNSTFLVVNSFGTLFRQDDLKMFTPSFDLKSGEDLKENVSVSLYSLLGKPTLITRYNSSGLLGYQLPWDKRLDLVLVRKGTEVAVVPVRIPQTQADIRVRGNLDSKSVIFLYTDRPIYKPKDVVSFRGIIRRDGDGLYSTPPAGGKVRVWLQAQGPAAKPIEIVKEVNSSGIFFGELTIPEQLNGTQYIYASSNLEKEDYSQSGNAYFDVEKYAKPEFELSTKVNKKEFVGKSSVEFDIFAKYFDQKPVKNINVSYTIYSKPFYESEKAVYSSSFNVTAVGGMCGPLGIGDDYFGEQVFADEAPLDQNGHAQISFDTKKIKTDSSQTITLVATRTDRSGNKLVSGVSTVMHASEGNVFFPPSPYTFKVGDEVVIPFYGESLRGQKLSERTFYFVASEGGETPKEFARGQVKTDSEGKGDVRLVATAEMEDRYLQVKITEAQGDNPAKGSKGISISKTTDQRELSYWQRQSETFLKIRSSQNSFVVNDTVRLIVQSPQKLTALLSLERGRIYAPRLVSLNAGENIVEINVSNDLSPSITPVFSFFADGKYYSEGLALNVPAMHKLLQVNLSSDKEKYGPNETAKIMITTKDSQGNPTSAKLSLGIVDKAIFALRKSATPALHSAFYFFRSRSTNASSSLSAIGFIDFGGGKGGGGGGGGGNPGRLVDTLYWNPSLETGTDGEVSVEVPLRGITTTWKAQVLASTTSTDLGQGELEILAAP